MSASPSTSSTALSRPTWRSQPWACSSVRRAALGELAGDRLDALAGDPREGAGRPDGDGKVGEAADAGVERGAGQLRAVQRADHREGGEVDAGRTQARLAGRVEQALDHVAPRGDDARRGCAGRRGSRRSPSEWCSSTACSSGIGMWSGAWKRIAELISLAPLSGGRSRVRMTMRWLATPRRTRFAELVLRRTGRAGRLARRLDVDDLAVTDDAGGQLRRSRRARPSPGPAASRRRRRSRARCRGRR